MMEWDFTKFQAALHREARRIRDSDYFLTDMERDTFSNLLDMLVQYVGDCEGGDRVHLDQCDLQIMRDWMARRGKARNNVGCGFVYPQFEVLTPIEAERLSPVTNLLFPGVRQFGVVKGGQ